VSSTIALLLTAALASAPEPWYERASCRSAAETVFTVEFAKADEKIAAIEATRDLDDVACALWIRATASELQIAVLGHTPELVAGRKKALSRLFGFAKANKGKGARFADLELEARLRRVRVLLEEGQASDALKESKGVQKMVEDRPAGSPTPTLDYVIGALHSGLASPGWAARTFLSIAGLGADKKLGAEAINKLADGSSIYKWDAMYIGHHFSLEIDDAGFRAPSSYSRPCLERFPMNPQFIFDLASDLWREKKYAEARKIAAVAVAKIDADPTIWSPKIRAKIYWIAGRTALDAGDRGEAKRRAELARAQQFRELEDKIDDLFDDLSG
jgi:hypothetical protein